MLSNHKWYLIFLNKYWLKDIYIWKRTKEAVKSHMKHPQYKVVRNYLSHFRHLCDMFFATSPRIPWCCWDQPMRCYLENWGRRVRLLSPTEIWGRRQCLGMMSQMLSLTRSAAEFLIIKILPISRILLNTRCVFAWGYFLLITLQRFQENPFYNSNEELTKAKQIIAMHSSYKSDIVWSNISLLL